MSQNELPGTLEVSVAFPAAIVALCSSPSQENLLYLLTGQRNQLPASLDLRFGDRWIHRPENGPGSQEGRLLLETEEGRGGLA